MHCGCVARCGLAYQHIHGGAHWHLAVPRRNHGGGNGLRHHAVVSSVVGRQDAEGTTIPHLRKGLARGLAAVQLQQDFVAGQERRAAAAGARGSGGSAASERRCTASAQVHAGALPQHFARHGGCLHDGGAHLSCQARAGGARAAAPSPNRPAARRAPRARRMPTRHASAPARSAAPLPLQPPRRCLLPAAQPHAPPPTSAWRRPESAWRPPAPAPPPPRPPPHRRRAVGSSQSRCGRPQRQ